jgi:hypothetical protein
LQNTHVIPLNDPFAAARPCVLEGESNLRPLKIVQFVQLAAALKRSPATLLAASDEAIPIIEQIDTSAKRREHVALFLARLEDPEAS